MLPRRHGTTAVGDLPEQLAVRLLLDLGGGPVGGLRRWQRGGGGAVTLAGGAVARRAIRLRRFLGVADALHRILLGLLGRGSDPLALRPRGSRYAGEKRRRHRSCCQRLPERPHGFSS